MKEVCKDRQGGKIVPDKTDSGRVEKIMGRIFCVESYFVVVSGSSARVIVGVVGDLQKHKHKKFEVVVV
jgi:hypothetical protein